jgi:AAA domain
MNRLATQRQIEKAFSAIGSATAFVSSNQPLKLTFFDELTDPPSKEWLIKNVVARGETSSWIGPPGAAKSALLTDLAVHVASGRDWRSHQTKGRCGTVYFALERAGLVKRRLAAYRRRDDLKDLPIAVAHEIINLMNPGCVDIILSTVAKAEERFGCDAGLIIIDSYSKGIAAGGGDEDKAKEQNITHVNMRRILEHKSVHIAGVGHTGKDETKGERGSNARLADVDLVAQITTSNGIKTVTVKKANDQPDGALTSFRLEPFDFGLDEDGDPVRTFIVSQEILTGALPCKKLSDRQKLALAALTEALLSHGRPAPAEYELPQGVKVVALERWKTELFRGGVLDVEGSNPRARFAEIRLKLVARHLIGVRDGFVWAAT